MSKKNRFNKPTTKPEKIADAPSYDVPKEETPVLVKSWKKKVVLGIIAVLAATVGIAYVLTPKAATTPVAPRPELASAETPATAPMEEIVVDEVTEEFMNSELTEEDKQILRD